MMHTFRSCYSKLTEKIELEVHAKIKRIVNVLIVLRLQMSSARLVVFETREKDHSSNPRLSIKQSKKVT